MAKRKDSTRPKVKKAAATIPLRVMKLDDFVSLMDPDFEPGFSREHYWQSDGWITSTVEDSTYRELYRICPIPEGMEVFEVHSTGIPAVDGSYIADAATAKLAKRKWDEMLGAKGALIDLLRPSPFPIVDNPDDGMPYKTFRGPRLVQGPGVKATEGGNA